MATGPGTQRLQLNTRERVLSSDANRAQAFQAQAQANMLRALLSVSADEDTNAGALEVLPTGTEAPLLGVVLSGLRCQPIDGTIDMLITPGAVLLSDNATPSTDDSADALVVDPGVQSTGVLQLVAGGGSVRIDVLEVQRISMVVETDNRDVFNPATGLFTPAQVDKVVVGRLSYRIRNGTGGAGWPGVVAGWLPLAVIHVAAGATTWDNTTIWDVRPLASDRWNAPFNTPHVVHERGRCHVFTDVITAGAERRVAGLVEATFNGYRAGGHLGITQTTGATSYIDVALAANRAANFPGYTANRHWYLYALFPYGLPRWVRYTDSGSGGRVPRGQRGILAVTSTPPAFDGRPNAFGIGVSPPTYTGLNGSSLNGICLLAGRVDAAGTPVPQGIAADGHVISHVNAIAHASSPIASTSPGVSVQWLLSDDVSHPAGARAIWVRLHGDFTPNATYHFTVGGQVQVTGPDAQIASLVQCEDMPLMTFSTTGGQLCRYEGVVRVPLVSNPFDPTNGGGSARSFRLLWSYNYSPSTPGVITDDGFTYEVIAWEMGP